MSAEIIADKRKIVLSNNRVKAVFSIAGRFLLDSFKDLENKMDCGAQKNQLFMFDRKSYDLTDRDSMKLVSVAVKDTDKAYSRAGKEAVLTYKLKLDEASILLEKHLFIYDNAPAVRIYDVFTSDTAIAGTYYSDIGSFKFDKEFSSTLCMDYFSCTDQSNYRLIEKETAYKNTGLFFLAWNGENQGIFLYKEGPAPDCQPIKGEYDFVFDKKKSTVSVCGLGFDKMLPGEKRRSNGLVIGLIEDRQLLTGIKRYQHARYLVKDAEIEYLANSWPAFHLDVNEEKINGEIEAAAASGIDTVIIDDGWFETFMGEVSKKKFPSGMKKIVERAAAKNVKMGLWMDPFGMDSKDPRAKEWDGAECHDTMVEGNPWNWVARSSDFRPVETVLSEGVRAYYAMDIMNKEYFKHITDNILSLCRDGIHRYKFDLYNLEVFNTLLGDANMHYEAYRGFLEYLKANDPSIAISMDVTRRNRPNFDFGMDFGKLFLENRGRNLKDHRFYHPYMALRNLWLKSKYVMPQKLELEMMPQIDDYPVEYIVSTTLCAVPLYWGSIKELGKEKEKKMKAFVEKTWTFKREIMSGLISPFGEMPEHFSWSGFISVDPEASSDLPDSAYVVMYKNGPGRDKETFTLNALAGAKYKMTDVFSARTTECVKGRLTFEIKEDYGFRILRLTRSGRK